MSTLNAIKREDIRRWLRFGPMLRSIVRYWRTQAIIRRDMNFLRHQPDRTLQDIGLLRADLPDDFEFSSNANRHLWTRHR